MRYFVTIKSVKYQTIEVESPDEESAKEFTLKQVKQQFPISRIIEIQDADIINKVVEHDDKAKDIL